jgi:energy-coupling factor transport system permease protein
LINTSITIGQYIPGDSIIHKADPRTKIIFTMTFMVMVFLISSFWLFTAMVMFTLIAVLVSGVPIKYTLRGLKPLIFIILFTAAINIFTTGGTPISSIFPLKYITYEGLALALRLAVRLAMIIVGGSLLTLTTTPILLTDGIESLFGPLEELACPPTNWP